MSRIPPPIAAGKRTSRVFVLQACLLVFVGVNWLRVGSLQAVEVLRFDQTEQTVAPSWQEKQAEVEFSFTNIGTQPISILNVHSSCGCVAVAPKEPVILPGASSSIKAKFIFGSRVGRQSKTIRVETNAQESPVVALKFTVEIPKVLTIDPPFVRWPVGSEPIQQTVKITLAEGVPVEVVGIEAPPHLMKTQWSVSGKQELTLSITPVTTSMNWNGVAIVHTNIGRDFTVFARAMDGLPNDVARAADRDRQMINKEQKRIQLREDQLTHNPPSVQDEMPSASIGNSANTRESMGVIPRVSVTP